MVDQWQSKYASLAFPFSIPQCVSGPDFRPDKGRWRRVAEAPLVWPTAFMRMVARRSSAAVRSSWTFVPAIRSCIWRWVSEHTFSIATPFAQKRGSATMTSSADYIQAAKNLCWHLKNGVVGSGLTRIRINGDTTLLPRAKGLSSLERRLAWAQHFLAKHMCGTQQVRQLMGHTQFGARVMYGDCIFFTISPNPQMSALVLRLSRYRQSDPYVKHGGDVTQRLARQDYPSLEAKRARRVPVRPDDSEQDSKDATVEIDIPSYELRLAATSRDPLAIMEAYRVEVLRLAAVLGVRMCPNCPRCNESVYGCQDLFGCNMRPMGGVLGGMVAFGGATEHQGHGTPHLHAEGHVACLYQFHSLEEIAEKIRKGYVDTVAFVAYNNHLHQSDVLDEATYDAFLPHVEEEKAKGFAGKSHDGLCVTPAYVVDDMASSKPTLADAYERADLMGSGKIYTTRK